MRQRGTPHASVAGEKRATTSGAWSIGLYEATDEVFWAARLNLLWIAFTLAGGVLFGVGPATVAAYTLARRHALGESFPAWATFAAVWRRQFAHGSLVVLPLAGATVLLIANYGYFGSLGSATMMLRLTTLAALATLAMIATYLLPMMVHYELPTRAYFPKALLFALTRPASSVLLLFVLAAIAYASALYPFLPPVISVGGWIQLDTWLCQRFFAENEARLRTGRIS